MKNLTAIKEGKLLALVTHFWFIGVIITLILNSRKPNEYVSFYVKQMLGWNIIAFFNSWFIYFFLGGFIKWVIGVILLIFWIISFVGCLSDEEKLIPFLGEYFQNWFKDL